MTKVMPFDVVTVKGFLQYRSRRVSGGCIRSASWMLRCSTCNVTDSQHQHHIGVPSSQSGLQGARRAMKGG